MSSFLLGSLLSLVSAALGYWAGGLRKANDDSKRRKAFATAILFELRPLERMLRTRAGHPRAAESTVAISMPVYDQFPNEVLLLPPDAAHTILELRSYVRDIELTAANVAGGRDPVTDKTHDYMRLKATLAANLILKARETLEKIGGKAPVDWEVETLPPGEKLELSKPAFPNAARLET
jgi:hypothetical protein